MDFYINVCEVNLGEIYLNLGKLDSARFYLERGFRYFYAYDNKTSLYHLTTLRASLALKEGKPAEARRLLDGYTDTVGIDPKIVAIRNRYLQDYFAAVGDYRRAYIYQSRDLALEEKVRNERIRMSAADSLAGFYMRKKQYDKAEKYLEYFSIQNPERKRKQARSIVQKQAEAAKFFEMGKYYEVSSFLEIAALEKDADTVIAAMEEMLSGVEEIESFRNSSLYEHMEFKEIKEEDLEEIKENLRKCFRDEENFEFLKNDSRYQNLIPAAGKKNSPNSRD